MKRLLSVAAILAAFTCLSSVSAQTTYTWSEEGNALNRANQDANFAQQHLRFAMPATNATAANIITSRDTGCATNVIDTVQVTTGPAPQIGEYAQATGGFQPYISEIIGVTQNTDGTYDIVLKLLTCEGFPVRSGVGESAKPS